MGLEFCGTSLFKRFENFRLNLLSWKCVHIFCIRTICLFLTWTGPDFKFLLKLGTIFVISCIKQIKRQTYKNKGLKKIKKNVKYIHYLKVNHSKNQEATHRLKNMLFKHGSWRQLGLKLKLVCCLDINDVATLFWGYLEL